jgi:hypothetical protein
MIRHIIASCSTVRIRNERYYRDKDDLSSTINVTIENEKETERERKEKKERKKGLLSLYSPVSRHSFFSVAFFSRVCIYNYSTNVCVCCCLHST